MSESAPTSDTICSVQDRYDALRNVSPEGPCPYLPGLMARHEAYHLDTLSGTAYERLLGRGFRRSGRLVYRPRCRACAQCRQIRVLVDEFVPSRSMRRIWRRNQDVEMRVGQSEASEEKYEVYRRYLNAQHDGTMSRDEQTFLDFLYDSPTESLEFEYLLGRRLLGVGIADVCPAGLSSVYMYFDPEFERRCPGALSVLREVAWCREQGLPYYYLGYFVAGSRTMAYKSRFRPNEILVGGGRWVRLRG